MTENIVTLKGWSAVRCANTQSALCVRCRHLEKVFDTLFKAVRDEEQGIGKIAVECVETIATHTKPLHWVYVDRSCVFVGLQVDKGSMLV